MERDDIGFVFELLDLAVVLSDDVLEAIEARYEGRDVIRGRDRDAYLVAGHDRDVVDRQHVRGIGHRHQQRALVGKGDRDRLVPLAVARCQITFQSSRTFTPSSSRRTKTSDRRSC